MFEYFRIRILIKAMWRPVGDRRPETIDQVAAIGLPAVPQLINAMKASPHTSSAAQEALVKIGRPAVPALIEALRHRNVLIRALAAEVLGEIGDAGAVEAMLPLLQERTDWVRREAVTALGKLGDPRAGDALLAMLGDTDLEVREVAAEALGRLKHAAAVEPLWRALDDRCENVQVAAAVALEQLNATEILLDALCHGSADVRACVAFDLAPEALSAPQRARAREALLANLADPDREVRDAAAAALRKLEELASSKSP